jgi:hypothetical protein
MSAANRIEHIVMKKKNMVELRIGEYLEELMSDAGFATDKEALSSINRVTLGLPG